MRAKGRAASTARAIGDAEAVLLVDHRQGQVVIGDVVLEQGVSAHGDGRLTRGQGLQLLRAPGALVAAREQHHADALRLQGPGEGFVVLAGEDLGRGHQDRLLAGGGRVGHGQHGHHGLARADVALQQARHAFAGGQVRADFGQRTHLGAGEGEGQGGLHRAGGVAVGDGAGGLLAADQLAFGHGQLVGEQLVIGQPPAERRQRQKVGLGARRMQRGQSLAPGREALARRQGRIQPLGQLGRTLQRFQHQLAHGARRQGRGGGIDRFDLGDLVGPFGGQHIGRVDDLQLHAAPLRLAADHPFGARGMLALQLAPTQVEEGQDDEAGLVERPDTPGRGAAARRKVAFDPYTERLNFAFQGRGRVGGAAHDQAVRRQEDQVAHQRPGQLDDQGLDLRPHALERRDGREQGE